MTISYAVYLFLRNAWGTFKKGFYLIATHQEAKNLPSDLMKQPNAVERGVFIISGLFLALIHLLLSPITVPIIALIKTAIDLKTRRFSSEEACNRVSNKLSSMKESEVFQLKTKICNYSPQSESSTRLINKLNNSNESQENKAAIINFFNKNKNNGKVTFQIIVNHTTSLSSSPSIGF